ncbi:cell division protein FtsA [Candidatus Symbiothrix dinenymphae]|nr:cell division protein FtsA [Candidatus Symbiothrix dinenymphae]
MEGYVAAIDLGTSKMLAVAAKKDSLNKLEILATESSPTGGCMARGRIVEMGEATAKVHSVVSALSSQSALTHELKKIYIGIGGQSLHSEAYSCKKEVDGSVTKALLVSLEDECECWEKSELLEITKPEYYLDGILSSFPEGKTCKEIEVRCLRLLERQFDEDRDPIEKILDDNSIAVAKFLISPLATAEIALNRLQKKEGCALVEIGAALTYVSIYKDSKLKFLVTIPLGGDAITADISALDDFSDAEAVKKNNGILLNESEAAETTVNKVIKARALEICANIVHQIKHSGYESEIKDIGIVLTGGGAQLKNFDKLLIQESGLPVQFAPLNDHSQACVQGLLLSGKDNCAKDTPKYEPPPPSPPPPPVETPPPSPVKTPKKGKNSIIGFMRGIFDES